MKEVVDDCSCDRTRLWYVTYVGVEIVVLSESEPRLFLQVSRQTHVHMSHFLARTVEIIYRSAEPLIERWINATMCTCHTCTCDVYPPQGRIRLFAATD